MKYLPSCLVTGTLAIATLSIAQNVYADIDCTTLTVTEIKQALDSNLITSKSCVTHFLNKINAISPVNPPHVVHDFAGLQTFSGLNAYTYLNPYLEQQAEYADMQRASGINKPLLGVPIAIKDTTPIIGFPNSAGNLNLRNQYTPQSNDPTIQRLLDAGAIIIGQNNQHEFGTGLTGINFSYGPARNAHDPSRIAGGSTGGGATAVASYIAPVAIGDDLGGSIRVPPALNGVIGFRPTISRYVSSENSAEVVPYAPYVSGINAVDRMGVRGIISRSISDVVLIDQFLSEDGGVSIATSNDLTGIRLGIPENFYANMEPDVANEINKALKKLESKGAILIKTIDIPNINPAQPLPGITGQINTYQDLFSNRAVLFFGGFRYWSEENNIVLNPIGPDTAVGVNLVNFLLPLIFPTKADEANYYNYVLLPASVSAYNAYQQYFAVNSIDAIIYPTINLKAAKIETIVVDGGDPLTNGLLDFAYTTESGRSGTIGGFYSENAILSPLLGTPSLSMPVGLTADTKLPVAIQIEGLKGDDAKILEIGSAFEATFGIFANQE